MNQKKNDFQISDKYIIEDTEHFLRSLWVYTKSSFPNLEEIAEYVNSNEDTELFITNQMCVRQESSYATEYVWLDTGLFNAGRRPCTYQFR